MRAPPINSFTVRTRVRQRYALFPLEGFPPSRIADLAGLRGAGAGFAGAGRGVSCST